MAQRKVYVRQNGENQTKKYAGKKKECIEGKGQEKRKKREEKGRKARKRKKGKEKNISQSVHAC